MLLLIGTIGFAVENNEYPNPTDDNFTWESSKVEFYYLGPDNISTELLETITKQTMELGKSECDETTFKPIRLTINGDPQNLLSTIEYETSESCSPTKGLQTMVIFNDDGSVSTTITTFN